MSKDHLSQSFSAQTANAQPYRRRDLLLGLGAGAALAAPLLRVRRAHAATPKAARRFFLMYTSNGHAPTGFGTSGNGASFTLQAGLSKAEAVKDYMSFVNRLSIKNRTGRVRDFHDKLPALLTGKTSDIAATGLAPSIDQAVANLTGKPPMTLKVYNDSVRSGAGNSQLLSWSKAGFPNRNEDKPVKIYREIFASVLPDMGSDEAAKKLLEQNKSLLDFNLDDLKLFSGRLQSSADRMQFEAHLERIRAAETSVSTLLAKGGADAGAMGGGGCQRDEATAAGMYVPPPQEGTSYNVKLFEAHAHALRKLTVAAFACGLRNSGTMLWQMEGGGLNPNGDAGQANDHHNVSHGAGGNGVWSQIDTYYSGQWANYLQDFKAAGILDDTIFVWATLLRNTGPADHSHNDLKFVIGGGKNLGIKYKQTIELPSAGGADVVASHSQNVWGVNDLWTTVLQAMGGEGTFGERVKGPIPGLWEPAG